MKPSFSFLFLLIFLPASAAPLTLDLGQGLAYHRAHALPADLPAAAPARPQPLVLDLRYATGDDDAATALSAWLKFRAAPRTPVFLLANSATSPALRAALTDRERTAGLIVLGLAGPGFEPDIALKTTGEAERLAYDALTDARSLSALINPSVEKPRNDEARLVADHRAGRAPDPAAADATSAPATPTPGPPPVTDAVLQRAVHLHRTLLALKKL
jgi:hypothetical protein